jgi:hypothetical protein
MTKHLLHKIGQLVTVSNTHDTGLLVGDTGGYAVVEYGTGKVLISFEDSDIKQTLNDVDNHTFTVTLY